MQQLKNPVVQPENTMESSVLAVKSDVFTDSVNLTNRTEPDAGSTSWAYLASSINDNDFVVVIGVNFYKAAIGLSPPPHFSNS